MEQLPALSNYTLYGECIGVSKFDEIAELAMDDLRIVSIELVGGKPKVEWERGHPAMDGTPVPSFSTGKMPVVPVSRQDGGSPCGSGRACRDRGLCDGRGNDILSA